MTLDELLEVMSSVSTPPALFVLPKGSQSSSSSKELNQVIQATLSKLSQNDSKLKVISSPGLCLNSQGNDKEE